MSNPSDGAEFLTTTRLRRERVSAPEVLDRYTCLTVMAGPEVGRSVRLNPGRYVVGRAESSDVVIPDDDVSRTHARLDVGPAGEVQVTDLNSTNGVWLAGESVLTCTLRPGEKFVLGSRVLLRVDWVDDLDMALRERLRRGSTTDVLTGCLNRRWLAEALPRELSLAARMGAPLAVAAVDIDYFKAVNDTYGHATGDEVLLAVVAVLRAGLRGGDGLVRLGGDEFLVVMRGAHLAEAEALVSGMAAQVRGCGPRGHALSISAGIAEVSVDGCEGPRALIQLADKRLYAAKRAGRGRVVSTGGADAAAQVLAKTHESLQTVRRKSGLRTTQRNDPKPD